MTLWTTDAAIGATQKIHWSSILLVEINPMLDNNILSQLFLATENARHLAGLKEGPEYPENPRPAEAKINMPTDNPTNAGPTVGLNKVAWRGSNPSAKAKKLRNLSRHVILRCMEVRGLHGDECKV